MKRNEYPSDENYETPRAPNLVNGLSNTLSFGFGLLQFILGIVYLSVYRYEYSLTVFSVDLIAGFMLTSGLIISFFCLIRMFFRGKGMVIWRLRDEHFMFLYISSKTIFSSYKTDRISVRIRNLFIGTECLLIGCVKK